MADYSTLQTGGGQKTAAVAAGSGTADVVVSALPGRVCRLVITTAGTAALELYDHASASSGAKLIWKSGATPAVDTDNITLDIPVANGIVAKQANGSAAVTIYFTEDTVAGAVADKSLPVAVGGQLTSYHAAGSSGAGAALASKGRLCRVVVLSSGSAATSIYDHASAASGTKLFTMKANPTVGAVYDIQAPCANGIYVGGTTNTSALLVTYTTNDAYGR